ncbi:hypothetical protein LZ31DRAFT_620675, partial [Colletotrichum somersetense]
IECRRASGDVDHSPAKEPVVVDFIKRKNSPEPAACSANCLPDSLPSLPSKGFSTAMFPSHPGPHAAKNTADPAIPQNSTKNASTVSLEAPAQESTPPYTEQLPQSIAELANHDYRRALMPKPIRTRNLAMRMALMEPTMTASETKPTQAEFS